MRLYTVAALITPSRLTYIHTHMDIHVHAQSHVCIDRNGTAQVGR